MRPSQNGAATREGTYVPPAFVEPLRRTRHELGIDIALPQVDRLHHMHFGIDQLEAVLGHGVTSRDCYTVGLMFWLSRNKFVGSNLFFSETSRS
jgi:hypothetical protein